jgi:putative ABC transport system substrate-binding protein
MTRLAVALLALVLLAVPLAAEAQQAQQVVRVAVLDDVSPRDVPWRATFERRLAELGYVEGKNLVIEFQSASRHADRLGDLAAEVVRLKPDVIVSSSGPDGARALKQATSTIPVIFSAIEWDPVAAGVVAGLVRPGSNLTGVSAPAATDRTMMIITV